MYFIFISEYFDMYTKEREETSKCIRVNLPCPSCPHKSSITIEDYLELSKYWTYVALPKSKANKRKVYSHTNVNKKFSKTWN